MRWLATPLLVMLAAGGATGSLEVRTEPGAEVLWEGTSLGSTDGGGRLWVQDVPPGTYRLVVKGSKAQVSTTVEVGPGETIVQLPLPSPPPALPRDRDDGGGSRRTAATAADVGPQRQAEEATAEGVAEAGEATVAVAGTSPPPSQLPPPEPAAALEVAPPPGTGQRIGGSDPPAQAPAVIEPVAPPTGSVILWVLAAVGLAALAAMLAWQAQARRLRRRRHRRRHREPEVERIEVSREGAGSVSGLVEQLRARERRLEDLVKARQGRRVVDVREFEDRGDEEAG